MAIHYIISTVNFLQLYKNYFAYELIKQKFWKKTYVIKLIISNQTIFKNEIKYFPVISVIALK